MQILQYQESLAKLTDQRVREVMQKLLEMGYSDYRKNIGAVAERIGQLKAGQLVTDEMML